jgi:hypothetical protein
MSLDFVCANGCGVCKVRLSDFEYYRSESLDGELIERKTEPHIVSACCGAEVDVWDERVQDVTGHVSVETIAKTQAGAPGSNTK